MAALAVFGEHVICTAVEIDPLGHLVADCTMSSDGADFAEVMIRAGHAAHCPAYGRPDLASLPTTAPSRPPTADNPLHHDDAALPQDSAVRAAATAWSTS